MIECTSDYIYKKKRRKKKNLWRFIALILIIILLGYLYNRFVVSSNLARVCLEYTSSKGVESVTNAVIFSLDKDVYSDIITIEKNNDGDVSLITTNSYNINKISREIITKTTSNMSDIIKKGVPIPCFAFTGIGILSGLGKKVYFKSITIAKVDCEFSSSFKSVGVNQTLHSIYADVKIDIDINFQIEHKSQSVSSSVLLCESVIVGKVPDTYLNGKIFN